MSSPLAAVVECSHARCSPALAAEAQGRIFRDSLPQIPGFLFPAFWWGPTAAASMQKPEVVAKEDVALGVLGYIAEPW